MNSGVAITTVSEIRQRESAKNSDGVERRRNIKARAGGDMSTIKVGVAYIQAIDAFKNLLSLEQTKGVSERNANVAAVGIHVESGRKFDKVYRILFKKNKTRSEEAELLFFVNRETGEIFGPKSELAPNERWYYGTIFNGEPEQWDWTGENGGVPKDMEKCGVEEVGKYADRRHFAPVKRAKTA